MNECKPLLPGGQKFEVYRIGYNAVCCGNLPGPDSANCPGKLASASAPEVFVDYRCHAKVGRCRLTVSNPS